MHKVAMHGTATCIFCSAVLYEKHGTLHFITVPPHSHTTPTSPLGFSLSVHSLWGGADQGYGQYWWDRQLPMPAISKPKQNVTIGNRATIKTIAALCLLTYLYFTDQASHKLLVNCRVLCYRQRNQVLDSALNMSNDKPHHTRSQNLVNRNMISTHLLPYHLQKLVRIPTV